jgi:hypothetical protein
VAGYFCSAGIEQKSTCERPIKTSSEWRGTETKTGVFKTPTAIFHRRPSFIGNYRIIYFGIEFKDHRVKKGRNFNDRDFAPSENFSINCGGF